AAALTVAVARYRIVERRGLSPNDDGDTAAEAFEVDREAPAVDHADPAVPEVFEAEDVGEELAREAARHGDGIVPRLRPRRGELLPERLGDPPVARDLVAELEPLLDAVVGRGLRRRLERGDLREPLRRKEPAFEGEGIELQRRFGSTSHGSCECSGIAAGSTRQSDQLREHGPVARAPAMSRAVRAERA